MKTDGRRENATRAESPQPAPRSSNQPSRFTLHRSKRKSRPDSARPCSRTEVERTISATCAVCDVAYAAVLELPLEPGHEPRCPHCRGWHSVIAKHAQGTDDYAQRMLYWECRRLAYYAGQIETLVPNATAAAYEGAWLETGKENPSLGTIMRLPHKPRLRSHGVLFAHQRRIAKWRTAHM